MEQLIKKLEREASSHKGQNGKVGIIGGSRDFTGAPSLSARSAYRAGSDLVKITTSETVRDVVAGYSENFLVSSYPDSYLGKEGIEPVTETVEWSHAAVIGPGLGKPDPETVKWIVSKSDTPLVIDADGIKPALKADISETVFTPHRKEKEMIEEKYGSVEEFVEKEESVVIVTGPTDRIYTPEETYENSTGDPSMTVGGTGDVLTGTVASLISQGLKIEEAARLGTWITGRAGEKASEKHGNGALATDVIEEITDVI